MAESMCSGCGAVADKHPFVGVTRDIDTGEMSAYPICYQCWSNPSHRQHPLKMHYFPAHEALQAVKAAEDNILVEQPSKFLGKKGDEPE